MATKFLDQLRDRLAATTDLQYAGQIKVRIAEVEARFLTLPQSLSLEDRDDIAMLEGQLALHRCRYGAERDIESIEARIAGLLAKAPAEAPATQQNKAA